jgi:phage-related protein
MSDLSFTWNGVSSDSMGVCVTRLPARFSAAQRVTTQVVTGRDGVLTIDDGALNEETMLCECYLPYEQGVTVAELDAIKKWLRGSGWWTQSDAPGRRFRARITDAISFSAWVPGFSDRLFGITLYAEPYEYVSPEPDDITVTSSGTRITNPGTAPSAPKITIYAHGDFTVSVGACYMEFEGISGGIIVDSELLDCLSLNGAQLLNSHVTLDDFPKLASGASYVSWTGSVTSVVITPRWRYY